MGMSNRFGLISLVLIFAIGKFNAQSFFVGADQSYVNEMEDCGVTYTEDGTPKDVHEIFYDHGCNLVRLRLWHTPSWYDELNHGARYSDLDDVKKSIRRVKGHGMKVLLNFHLSDNWADPSKQLVPGAWLDVVDETEILKDSLHQYIRNTLMELAAEGLLPEMVQIGNETNRGILLSPKDNETWTLDWPRNIILFNAAIQAVRDVAELTEEKIEIVLHFADPGKSMWFIDEFQKNGIMPYDIIGVSYYWAWHKPTTIDQTGQLIIDAKKKYPDKDVLIVETGYIWTTENDDNAPNIISETHPEYEPASPENQKQWLIDLTQQVFDAGGLGVIYWEPSWVATDCWNQWHQGSHQEHATFFDFDYNLIQPGGIDFMAYDYGQTTAVFDKEFEQPTLHYDSAQVAIQIDFGELDFDGATYSVTDISGRRLLSGNIQEAFTTVPVDPLSPGVFVFTLHLGVKNLVSGKFMRY